MKHSESHTNWRQSRGRVTFRPTGWLRSTQRYKAMKTHSNGCKPRIAIALSGWDTSPSIRSLIAIATTVVFKSSSGESTCSELDYENLDTLPPSVAVCIQLIGCENSLCSSSQK